MIATEAAMATGLPVWVAFTASMAPDGQTVRMSMGGERRYGGSLGESADVDFDLADGRP